MLKLHWFAESHGFEYNFTGIIKLAKELPATERIILKIIAMFYDILVLISPITLQFRLIFYSICLSKCDWDTELEPIQFETWNKIIRGLKLLKRVSVARHVLCKCGNREIELLGFSDSSREAYCACIYVLKMCSRGTTVTFLTNKCCLVPLKSFTTPHLELLACVLLSKLFVSSVLEELKGEVKLTAMFCWSDSMMALLRIKEVFKQWVVWVQNRVEVSRGNTSPYIWFHMPSTSNPSDICTRSISLVH